MLNLIMYFSVLFAPHTAPPPAIAPQTVVAPAPTAVVAPARKPVATPTTTTTTAPAAPPSTTTTTQPTDCEVTWSAPTPITNVDQPGDVSPGPESGGANLSCSEVAAYETSGQFPPGTSFTSETIGVFPPIVTTYTMPPAPTAAYGAGS